MAEQSHSSKETSYSHEVEVPVINKRSIGKLIIKYCGNEGQKDDETLVVTLRTLLQATITKLDTEKEDTWQNAEIVIYDQLGSDFCIRSGEAANKFVVQLNGEDEIEITCLQRAHNSLFSRVWNTSSSLVSGAYKTVASVPSWFGPTTESVAERKPDVEKVNEH